MPTCLIVASHFPPMRSAGVFRTLRITRYLPEHDWKLHVLTLDESAYLNGASSSQELLNKIPDEVCIHRTSATHRLEQINAVKDWVRKGKRSDSKTADSRTIGDGQGSVTKQHAADRNLLQRVKDGITLPLMTPDRWIGWLPFAVREGRQILSKKPIDVIYSSGPPWTNHLVALRLKQAKQTPWVADFRDPWLGNNFRPQRQGDTWVGRQHQTLERNVVDAADVVILNTQRALESIVNRYSDQPTKKFVVIHNGYDPADFCQDADLVPMRSGCLNANGPMRLVHAGAFYGKRNVDSLIRAVGDLQCSGQVSASDLQIDLIGAARSNRSHEVDWVRECGVEEIVNVLPGIPHQECVEKLWNSDVLLLVQTNAPLCIPGKAFEYIAIDRPVFTLSGPGATADLVRKENLGKCVDPQDMEQIRSGLLELIKQYQAGQLERSDGKAKLTYDGRQQMSLFDSAFKLAIRTTNHGVMESDSS